MIPVQKVLVRYTVTAGVLEYAVPFALSGSVSGTHTDPHLAMHFFIKVV